MAFDLSTAKPVGEEINTALPKDLMDDEAKALASAREDYANATTQHQRAAIRETTGLTDSQLGGTKYSPMQRRMGLGRKDSGTADSAVDSVLNAGYNLGGKATDLAAKYLPPEAAAAVGTAANLGVEAATLGAGGAVGKAPQAARAWMQSALKPVLPHISSGKAERAISTLLDKGLPATREGVEALRGSINSLESQVAQIISQAQGSVDKNAVLMRLKSVFDDYRKMVPQEPHTAAIKDVAQGWTKHPDLAGRGSMTVQEAQDFKQAIYRDLGDKSYGMGLRPAAERDAKKALARGLREDIESVAPSVGPLNRQASDEINALKVLARRTGVEANKNPVGLGWLVHDPKTLALWMADRSPAFKSAVAHGLNTGRIGQLGATPLAAQLGLEPERTLADIIAEASQ